MLPSEGRKQRGQKTGKPSARFFVLLPTRSAASRSVFCPLKFLSSGMRYLTLLLLSSVMALNACGTRGSLYLPPRQDALSPVDASTVAQDDPGMAESSGS
ncbi:MAG: lipoprotein [Candidatus Accumulibacter sp.]|nr:lipoprotein [Accumulibacter sp.]